MAIKGQRNYTKCITCKNDVRTFECRPRKFCSRECYKKSMIGNTKGLTREKMLGNKYRKGKKPWNYIDGRSKTCSPARYGDDWEKIRLLIYKRDNYLCQDCGMTMNELGKPLDVHHKNPFLISLDNSFSNLISLCRSCHRQEEARVMRELKKIKLGGIKIWQQQQQMQ